MNIKDFFIWDQDKFEIMKQNILGGLHVKLRNSETIFKYSKIKTNTQEVIHVNFDRVKTYLIGTFAPLLINSYTIVTRWINRPERNPNEFHNWSKLSLAHIEFAGFIIMIGRTLSHLTVLGINYLINHNYSHHEVPRYIKRTINTIIIVSSISVNILYFTILWISGSIIYEEIRSFINKEFLDDTKTNGIDKLMNISNSNLTYDKNDIIEEDILQQADTKFANLDYEIFLLLGLFNYAIHLPIGFLRLLNLNNGIRNEKLTEKSLKRKFRKTISKYDPHSVREINNNIVNISNFSLLRIMIWGKRQIPNYINKVLIPYIKRISGLIIYRPSKLLIIPLLIPLTFIIISLLILAVSISIIIMGLGMIGLIIKVNQVSFVGEIELLDWDFDNWRDFIAFLNNMLGLDTSKEQSLEAIMKFLFAGEDADQNRYEYLSKYAFLNSLTSYSISHQGVFRTLILLPQIETTDIQKIFVYETKIIQDEGEEQRNNYWINGITEEDNLVLLNELPLFMEDI